MNQTQNDISEPSASPSSPSQQTQETGKKFEQEDLAFRLQVAQKYRFIDDVKQGDYIDAQDTINAWCVGLIQKISQEGKLSVHFDGWSNKWDQTFHHFQLSIAPFRSHTVGYTGQQKFALRNELTIEQINKLSPKIREVIDNELEFDSAFELSQFIRGTLFIYVDFLLSHDYRGEEEEINISIKFIKLFIELTVVWMRKFRKLFKSLIQHREYPKLYLVDRNVALVACLPQITDLLTKIFCQDARTIRYYESSDVVDDNNGAETEFTIEYDISRIQNVDYSRADISQLEMTIRRANPRRNNQLIYGKLITFFNHFCYIGGLDTLLDLINAQQQQEGSTEFKPLSLPVDMIVSLTSPFQKLNDIVTPKVAERLVLGIKDTIFNRLDKIEDRDLKDLDKDLINRTLRNMKEFLQLYYKKDQANKMIDTTQLLMALRFLKTPFMQKRIKGLNQIKNVVERVSQKQGFSPKKTSSSYDQDRFSTRGWSSSSYYNNYNNYNSHYSSLSTWIDAPYLIEWINNSQLLDILLNPENTHAEVIKRTPSILRFLAQNNSLSNEMLDKLWACQQGGKHQAIVNAVLQVVTEVASVLSLDQLNMLYNRIKTTPHEQCDESFVKFLKDFSKNAILSAYREFKKVIRRSSKQLDSPRVEVTKKQSKTNIGQYTKKEKDDKQSWGAGSGETEQTQADENNDNNNTRKQQNINHPDLYDPLIIGEERRSKQHHQHYSSKNDSSDDENNANNFLQQLEDETQQLFDLCIDIQNKTIREDILQFFATSSNQADTILPQTLQNIKLRSLVLSNNSFGLPYLWNMMQDDAHQISPQLANQARLAIEEILNQDHCKDLRLFMLFKALNNGQKFKSVTQSFQLAKSILSKQTPDHAYIPTSSSMYSSKDYHPLLTKLHSYINVIETAVLQIEKYIQIVQKSTGVNKTNQDPRDAVFLSKFSHSQTIQSLFSFIFFCVTRARHQHDIKLGEDYIKRLWNIIIRKGNFDYDAQYFLNWLQIGYHVSSYTTISLCNEAEKQFLFDCILCQKQYTENPEFSMIFFRCFESFFKQINIMQRNLEIQKPSYNSYGQKKKQEPQQSELSVLNFGDLIGIDSLWVITFHATDENVRNAAIKLLVDLHLRISNQKQKMTYDYHYSSSSSSSNNKKQKMQKQEIWITFIERCMGGIKTCYQNLRNKTDESKQNIERIVSTSLKALSKFLDGHLAAQVSQGIDAYAQARTASNNPIMLEIQPDGISKTIHLPYTCSYGNVKIAVQKALNVQSTTQFVILNKKGRLLANDDAQSLKAYNWSSIYVHRIQKKRNLIKELEQLETQAQLQKIQQNKKVEKPKSKAKKQEYNFDDDDSDNDENVNDLETEQSGKSSTHPKYIISKHPEYIDLLVGLLEVGQGFSFVKPAWDLLMKLPVSRKLAVQLRDFKGENDQPFDLNELLPRSSIHKMLYSLQIVKELLDATQQQQTDNDQQDNWGLKFIRNGGVLHLIQAMKQQNVEKIQTSLQIKYFAILLTLFQKFSQMNIKESSSQISENKVQIVHKILRLFTSVSEYTIEKEQKLIEEEQKSRGHKLQNTGTIKRRKKKKQLSKFKGMGDSDQEQKQQTHQVKQTSAQKWGMADDDQEVDDGFEREDDPLVIESNEEAQIFYSSMKFLFFNSSVDRMQEVQMIGEIISTIYKFEKLEELLSSSLLRSVNYKIRDQIAKIFKQLFTIGSDERQAAEMNQLIPDAALLKKRVLQILVDKLLPQAFNYQETCEAFFELFSCVFIELNRDEISSIFKFSKNDGNSGDLESFLNFLSTLAIQKQSIQFSQNDTDCLLIGLFNLINAIVRNNPHLKQNKAIQGQAGLLLYIIRKCLFQIPSTKSQAQDSLIVPPPKCKSQESRDAAFDLVLSLVEGNKTGLMNTIMTLLQYHRNNSWRSRRKADWQIMTYQSEKSSTGFVGLKNLGCICYLNSIMQQLFMTSSFRDDILACPDNQRIGQEVKDEDNVLLQIQLLFGALKMSEKMYFNPQGFCHAFKDWQGQPINVIQQMDADQFFSMLMDKLQGLVKGTHVQKTVTENFGGKFANQIICKDCPHFSERQEPFLAVSLQVKGKKTIQESLEAFVAGDLLEGDNAFYCDKCDKKVTALKRACIKRLPRTLVMPLKRFEYNFDTMQRSKCNDYCEFPDTIDMQPYTQEGLKRAQKIKQREKMKRQRQAAGQDDDEVEDDGADKNKTDKEDDLSKKKYPDDYYLYKLVGVVIHIGTAESGHYYSLINDRQPNLRGKTGNDNWYEFNDTRVTPFDKSEIPNQSFGGEEVWTSSFYSNYSYKSEKMRNAYLLLYERVSPWEPPEDEQLEKIKQAEKLQMQKRKNSQTPQTDGGVKSQLSLEREKSKVVKDGMLQYIFENMESQNLRYWYNRFLFSDEYQSFIERLAFEWSSQFSVPSKVWTKNLDKLETLLTTQSNCDDDDDDSWKNCFNYNYENRRASNFGEILNTQFHKVQLKKERQTDQQYVFRFICSYFLVVLIRSKNRRKVPTLIDILKSYINRNEKCAEWILTQFTYPQIIKQFFFQCPIEDMRQIVAGLITASMIKVYSNQKEKLHNYWKWYDEIRQDQIEKKEQIVSYADGARRKMIFDVITKFDIPKKDQTTVLGNFINSLIRELETGKNYKFHLAEYFKIIAKFSLLGEEAIDYLLRCRVVGKFSEFFMYSGPDEVIQRIRDSSHLRTYDMGVVELGQPINVSTAGLSNWDQLVQSRKEKNIAQRYGDLAYMWQTLSRCIRSTSCFPNQSKFMLRQIPKEILQMKKQQESLQKDDYRFENQQQPVKDQAKEQKQEGEKKEDKQEEEEEEKQLNHIHKMTKKPIRCQISDDEKNIFLNLTEHYLKQMFQHGGKNGTTVGMRELGMLYGHICHGSLQNSKIVQKALITGINERDYDGIQPYMAPLKYFIDIDDQLQEQRVNIFMNTYVKIMKENKNYAKFSRSLIFYLIKFARLNHYVQSFIKSNHKKFTWIIDWIRNAIQDAGYQYSGISMSTSDKKNLKGDRIELESIIRQTPEQEEKLRKLFITQWDDDNDMQDYILTIGDKVDILQSSSYVQGTVIQVLDQMIQVQYQFYSHIREAWYQTDVSSLMPPRTKSSSQYSKSRATLRYIEELMHNEEVQKKKQEQGSQQIDQNNSASSSRRANNNIMGSESSSSYQTSSRRQDSFNEDQQEEDEDN